jgi:hypothetical protein
MGVTLTPACLRLLGVQDGGTVQVVPHASGKVIIAPMRVRLGAQAELVSAAREVLSLRRQVSRLRKRLMALPKKTLAAGVSIGYAKAYRREMLDLGIRLDQLTQAVGRIEHLFKSGGPPPGEEAASDAV